MRGLVKRYGSITAVDHVDLTVGPGDVYGYLGPNGAGKTTTLRMMLGLIRRDGGSVSLFGRDPARGAAAHSLGMRQRLGIAASLMRSPRLLVLDEPANGLDPAGIRDLRTLIAQLPEQGVTVLYSSHLLAEVEDVCNRVAIVDRGRIAFEGRLDELRASFGSSYVLQAADESRALAAAAALGIGARLDRGAIRLDASEELADRLTLELGRAGVAIRHFARQERSLEELFFQLTEADAA